MRAAKLYGPLDMRIEDVPEPPPPKLGEALIEIGAVGVCGSDLHYYQDGGIGPTRIDQPAILGHEFGGRVLAVGEGALDGNHRSLEVGARVAVEPCVPCYECEMCEKGHPNLCPNHVFYGSFPTDGALQEKMIVRARNCFPIPDSMSDGGAGLLETLGVAIHALDLSKLKIGAALAVIGCGPVGLLILRLARLAGAGEIYAFDRYPWRVEKAREWGATHAWTLDEGEGVRLVGEHTGGRGVDVAIEAAWADESVQAAAGMTRYGGRLVLVGIPSDDRLTLSHSGIRRKGLTLMVCRRMKHTYPRAIQLADGGGVDLEDLISHHLSLEEAARAFEMNLAYEEGIHKIIIDVR